MTACKFSSNSEKTTSIRLKHILVPIDTKDYWPSANDPVDRVIDTEAPTVLREVVSSLASLHACQNSGSIGVVPTLRTVHGLCGSEDLVSGLIRNLIGGRFGGKLCGTGKPNAVTLWLLVERFLASCPYALESGSRREDGAGHEVPRSFILIEMNI